MALSDAARLKFKRCVKDMRRGRASSADLADDLLASMAVVGLDVVDRGPNLEAMAEVLTDAGYQVVPPKPEPPAPPPSPAPVQVEPAQGEV